MRPMMPRDTHRYTRSAPLHSAWLVWTSMLMMLGVYIVICHLWGEQIRAATELQGSILGLRTVFYMVGLATFPIISFLRRKMLQYPSQRRGQDAKHIEPTQYDGYFLRIVTVSLALADSIGLWGFVLFILGDSLQTLYLFCGMSALAMVLYRPKMDELERLRSSIER